MYQNSVCWSLCCSRLSIVSLLTSYNIVFALFVGGPGGPGTVFFKQNGSPGIGKLIIDNFGKNPYIKKPSSLSSELDAVSSGKTC